MTSAFALTVGIAGLLALFTGLVLKKWPIALGGLLIAAVGFRVLL